jgi:hypothetical protein
VETDKTHTVSRASCLYPANLSVDVKELARGKADPTYEYYARAGGMRPRDEAAMITTGEKELASLGFKHDAAILANTQRLMVADQIYSGLDRVLVGLNGGI